MRHATILVAVLAFVPLTSATAQDLPPMEPGQQVRVTESDVRGGDRYRGTLVAFWDDTLVMLHERQADTLRISLSWISKIEVSRGQRRRTGRGAYIGLLAGGISGAVAAGAICAGSSGSFLDCSDEVPAAALMGGVTAGALGAGIGALIGLATFQEKWEEVPLDGLRVSFVPQRDGRFGLGLSVGF